MSFFARLQLALIALALAAVATTSAAIPLLRGRRHSARDAGSDVTEGLRVLESVSRCVDGDEALSELAANMPVEADARSEWFRYRRVPALGSCDEFTWMASHPDLQSVHASLESYLRARVEEAAALEQCRATALDKRGTAAERAAAQERFLAADELYRAADQGVRDARDRYSDVTVGRLVALLEQQDGREDDIALVRVIDAAGLLGPSLHYANPYAPLDLEAVDAGARKLERELGALPVTPRFAAVRAAATRVLEALTALRRATPEASENAYVAAVEARCAFLQLAEGIPIPY